MKRVTKLIVCCFAAMLLLSGCEFRTVDEMYALPKRPDSFLDLQTAIDSAMIGLEYCAPKAGENQQTVQSADLDGDGHQEYLIFAKESAQQPLRILIFREANNAFTLMDTISCNGSGFDRVEYAQMDDKPGVEIIVGRQINDQVLRFVSVYTMTDTHAQQLLNTGYSQYLPLDMDEDGLTELFILRPGPEENATAVAELYGMEKGAMERSMEVDLSAPAGQIKRVVSGRLQGGTPAVYVASLVDENSLITDVYAVLDGGLTNVAAANSSDTGVQTIRNYYVYADDLDGDGVMELPALVDMIPITLEDADAGQKLIRWYAMNKNGEMADKLYTYHDFTAGWYMEVDGAWAGRLTVAQQGSDYDFFLWDKNFRTPMRIFTVSVLTGQNREQIAASGEYVILLRTDRAVYAATMSTAAKEYGITEEILISRFHLIRQPWNSGET